MAVLDDLTNFDLDEATVSLWIIRKYQKPDAPPSFKARWVATTAPLDTALKAIIAGERERIEEVQEYGLLAQNNEGSALSIQTDETHAGLLIDEVAAETQAKKAAELRQIQNSDFYIIKVTSGDVVIHCVSKTDQSWRARKVLTRISAFFEDAQFGLDTRRGFDISRSIDFIIVGETILIHSKGHFESILSYKQAHRDDFVALRAEAEFISAVSDFGPLIAFVGDNKIQLRRVSAIRQMGYYKDDVFMTNLRETCADFGFNIQFDAQGRIVPTPETCRDIIRALLDHRLASPFTKRVYDVPDATVVAIAAL